MRILLLMSTYIFKKLSFEFDFLIFFRVKTLLDSIVKFWYKKC